MPKPVTHIIPLTASERDLVVALLTGAGQRDLAITIRVWPEVDDMVELAIIDTDREVVYDVLDRPGRDWQQRCARGDELRQNFDSDDYKFSVEGATVTGREISRLTRMWGDYKVDIETARAVLLASKEPKQFFFEDWFDKKLLAWQQHKKGYYGPVMLPWLRKVARDGIFINDERARPPSYYFDWRIARRACAIWSKVGLCKLRRQEPTGRRRYARLVIDWEPEMYLPPKERRAPYRSAPPPLSTAEEKALEGLA